MKHNNNTENTKPQTGLITEFFKPNESGIDATYAERNIVALYRAGKGGKYEGLTVIRRQHSKGNTYVTVEQPSGERWKLAQRWSSRSMRHIYSAERVGATLPPAEEIIDERTVGGVTFTLRRVVDIFFIEENCLGDSYTSEPPYKSLTEACFAFEVLIGREVARSQDYGPEPEREEPIGYYESRAPYLF